MRTFIAAALALALAACAPTPVATSPTPIATPTASASTSPSTSPSPTVEPSAQSFSAIQRLNERVGFIASFNGGGAPLAKTADGGATWQRLTLPAAGYLGALRFIDERVGWAAAFFVRDVPQIGCQQAAPAGAKPCRGVVLRTADGGATWTEALTLPIVGFEAAPVRALQAVDGDVAWVVTTTLPCTTDCDAADLQRTTDGGRTWRKLFAGRIAAIRFASATRGWLATYAANDRIELRTTADGGATWSAPFPVAGSGGYAGLDAASTSVAWLLTRDGGYCTSSTCQKYELWRTTNGGGSWTSLGNPKRDDPCFYGHLVGPLFASPSRGWLGLTLGAGGAEGTGGLLATNDGGATWSCAKSPENTSLVSAADPDHVWAVSGRGTQTLYASDDGGKTWRALPLR